MNYVVSVLLGVLLESAAVISLSLGNSLRIFHTNDTNMNLCYLLISLVFLSYCIAYAIYYGSAAKASSKTFRTVKQDKLTLYMHRSVITLSASYLVILILAVASGFGIFFDNATFFPLPSLVIMILLYSLLYLFVFTKLQPKGISFSLNTK